MTLITDADFDIQDATPSILTMRSVVTKKRKKERKRKKKGETTAANLDRALQIIDDAGILIRYNSLQFSLTAGNTPPYSLISVIINIKPTDKTSPHMSQGHEGRSFIGHGGRGARLVNRVSSVNTILGVKV